MRTVRHSAARLARKRKRRAEKAEARLLRALRKFARDRREFVRIVHLGPRRVILFPEDVAARTNKQLLALICGRRAD